MDIEIKDKNNIKIFSFEGNLDTNTSTEAEKELMRSIDEGASKILINFEKLDFIASSGLRILLATAKRLKSESGELRICSLNETVREVFDISGFITILNVFDSETEALEGF